MLGVLASRGLQYGVEAHMRRALDYGATRDELFEAIKAAAVPGGGVAYNVGVRAWRRWSKTAPSHRPPRPPHPVASKGKPPHSPARLHPQPAGGAQPRSGKGTRQLWPGPRPCATPRAVPGSCISHVSPRGQAPVEIRSRPLNTRSMSYLPLLQMQGPVSYPVRTHPR